MTNLPTNRSGVVTADTILAAVGKEPARTWPIPDSGHRQAHRPVKPAGTGPITTKQVADIAGVDRSSLVARWARQGKFRVVRRGRGPTPALYDRAEVLAWLDQRAAKKRGAR